MAEPESTRGDTPIHPLGDDVPDLAERGAEGHRLDERLYMRLLVFTGANDLAGLAATLGRAGVTGALYADVHDPCGVGLLTIHRDPEHFVGEGRTLLQQPPFDALTPRPQMTMFGRTYAMGYERDLNDTLFERPLRHALSPDRPWAIWYPLRRKGAFEQLPAEQQRDILMEHARVGMRFGRADLVHDVRLASHGLDPHDNDFLLGLMSRSLHPLSAIVQTMRGTQQTSLYIDRLGPFFVGRAVWQGRAENI